MWAMSAMRMAPTSPAMARNLAKSMVRGRKINACFRKSQIRWCPSLGAHCAGETRSRGMWREIFFLAV